MCAVVIQPLEVERHARACSKLYEHYVLKSTCTFEEDPPDLRERLQEVVDAGLPAIVAVEKDEGEEEEDLVIGYAYCSLWSPRSSYRYTLSPSCYVHKDHHRKGVGQKLMRALLDACREGGIRQLISTVGDEENMPSIKMHEALGTSTASRDGGRVRARVCLAD